MGPIYVMSGGGGSSGKNAFAQINVTYPAGSVCTCTNGVKTVKADNSLGAWTFNLPGAGSWTINSSNGSKSTSKTVSITAQGQVEIVDLVYELILLENGTDNTAVTGGWSRNGGDATNAGVTHNPSESYTQLAGGSNGYYRYCTGNKIDLTSFAALKAVYMGPKPTLIITSNTNTSTLIDNNIVAQVAGVASTAEYTEVTLDISGVTGENYPCFKPGGTTKVRKFWLE